MWWFWKIRQTQADGLGDRLRSLEPLIPCHCTGCRFQGFQVAATCPPQNPSKRPHFPDVTGDCPGASQRPEVPRSHPWPPRTLASNP